IASAEGTLGVCLSLRGQYQDAEPRLLRAYEALRDSLNPRAASTRTALERLVALYEAWGKPEEADEYRTLLDHGP
ncbi:MAG: tetratricopeptide repeat protein, partial [Thermoanaerobaculia bacterium]